jgi:hypothetical protein
MAWWACWRRHGGGLLCCSGFLGSGESGALCCFCCSDEDDSGGEKYSRSFRFPSATEAGEEAEFRGHAAVVLVGEDGEGGEGGGDGAKQLIAIEAEVAEGGEVAVGGRDRAGEEEELGVREERLPPSRRAGEGLRGSARELDRGRDRVGERIWIAGEARVCGGWWARRVAARGGRGMRRGGAPRYNALLPFERSGAPHIGAPL